MSRSCLSWSWQWPSCCNMGSSIMFGRISFFTFSTAAILQLAVSMDYSIFLLHTYTAIKQSGVDSRPAMEAAIEKSCSSILASGATTIVGFLVIALMKFTIGRDVGFVLTKGIVCSLVTVLFLMPTLILRFDKQRLREQQPTDPSFLPPLGRPGKADVQDPDPGAGSSGLLCGPLLLWTVHELLLLRGRAPGSGPGTRVYEDSRAIEDVFGS